jgi:hypothetical protein
MALLMYDVNRRLAKWMNNVGLKYWNTFAGLEIQ